jgi:YHS domain-containing protein
VSIDDVARARLENTITAEHEDATDTCAAILSVSQDELHMATATVRGDLNTGAQQAALSPVLQKVLDHREALFDRPQVLPLQECEALIDQGLFLPSTFGTWSPVQCYGETAYQPQHTTRFPLTYRGMVYYFATADERSKFSLSPRFFLRAGPSPAAVPQAICVVGPPRCGKSTLVAALALELNVTPITSQSAVEHCLRHSPTSGRPQEPAQACPSDSCNMVQSSPNECNWSYPHPRQSCQLPLMQPVFARVYIEPVTVAMCSTLT